MSLTDLMDSSYMAMDILYRQERDINRALNKTSEIRAQVSYSEAIISSIRSSWRWLYSWIQTPQAPPQIPSPCEPVNNLNTLLDIQKAIGNKLDNQMCSLIHLEEETDKVINKIDKNTRDVASC